MQSWTRERIGKYGAGLLGVLILVSGGVAAWDWYESTYLFDPNVDPDTIQDTDEYLEYYENLEEAYKRDTHGGDTPEETLELFISALEDGNATKASSYVVLQNQKEAKQRIHEGIEKGGVEALVSAYQNGNVEKTFREYADSYDVDIYPPGEEVGFHLRLVLNSHTNVWKVYEF